MKKVLLPLILLALMISGNEASAQSLKRALHKTIVQPSRAANNVAQDKAEDEAEKQLTKAMMEGFGITEDAKFEPKYEFDSWFQMQITNYKKNGKVDHQILYDNYVSKESTNYGMQYKDDDGQATILFDSERYAMIILSNDDGEKTGFATNFDPDSFEYEEDDTGDDLSDLKPLKTGKTKKILGYTCDEYLLDEESHEVHMWISEKLGKEIRKELLNNPNAFGAAFQHARTMEGMILEYDLVDKESGEKTEMLVTDLDLNRKHSISTDDYTIISMNLGGQE